MSGLWSVCSRLGAVQLYCLLALIDGVQAASLEIAAYAGGRDAAFSMTFDDGFRHQGETHVKMLKPYGFTGTFFIVVGQTLDHKPPKQWGNRMSWELLKELHAQGHEIANHSWSHAALKSALGAEKLEEEINHAYDVFKQKMGFAPYSFAFPGGSRASELMDKVNERHPMVRGKVLTYGGARWTTQQANAWVDDAIAHKKWIVPMIHAISKGWSSFRSPEEFDAHLRYVKSKEDAIWVAPLGDVAKYQKQRAAAKLSGKIKNNAAEFALHMEGLDPAVYTMPLSIIVGSAAGKELSNLTATCDGQAVTAYVLRDKICVDLVPHQKPQQVTVRW